MLKQEVHVCSLFAPGKTVHSVICIYWAVGNHNRHCQDQGPSVVKCRPDQTVGVGMAYINTDDMLVCLHAAASGLPE